MSLSGAGSDRGNVRIHESLDELSTDLADYIGELSEASVKERGVFAIALSGGSLVGLMGYYFLSFCCLVSLVLWF
jgi:6-phosphogluconolactonase